MTATITAIARKAGTITVENARDFWEPPTAYMHPTMFRAMADILKQEYPDDLLANIYREDIAPWEMTFDESRSPGTLSAPAIVALTTLCAMEWLRHRKQTVAEAERSGDYAPLLQEFVTWLRALFASWRAALGAPSAP